MNKEYPQIVSTYDYVPTYVPHFSPPPVPSSERILHAERLFRSTLIQLAKVPDTIFTSPLTLVFFELPRVWTIPEAQEMFDDKTFEHYKKYIQFQTPFIPGLALRTGRMHGVDLETFRYFTTEIKNENKTMTLSKNIVWQDPPFSTQRKKQHQHRPTIDFSGFPQGVRTAMESDISAALRIISDMKMLRTIAYFYPESVARKQKLEQLKVSLSLLTQPEQPIQGEKTLLTWLAQKQGKYWYAHLK